jgi:uncharacterized Tic20 family protein
MADTAPFPPYEPTADERSMATLAHALQMVGGPLAPLIIWLIKRESRYVSFHALQALFWQITFIVCWFLAMAVFMTAVFWTVATLPASPRSSGDGNCEVEQSAPAKPPARGEIGAAPSAGGTAQGDCNEKSAPLVPFPKVFVFFPLMWLFFMGMWVVTIVLSIVYAIKASRGEWANYPVLGRFVRSVLHLPPGAQPS